MKLLLTILFFTTLKLLAQSVTIPGNVYLSNGTVIYMNNQKYIHSLGGGAGGDVNENTVFGYKAGDSLKLSGYANTIVGKAAANKLNGIAPNGSSNTIIGYQSFQNGTIASFNTTLGTATLGNVTFEQLNTAIGYHSLNFSSGANNTATGAFTLVSNKASNLTAFGFKALWSNVDGIMNTAIGFAALQNNISGAGNTAVGYMSLMNNINTNALGFGNTAIGKRALYSNTTGYVNFAGGEDAGYSNTTGYGNTWLGRYAGYYNVSGNDNICVGKSANTSAPTASNELNLAGSLFGVNNYNLSTSRIGIGVVTPNVSAKLEIQSTTTGFLPPRMTSVQVAAISSPAEGLTVYDLTIHKLCVYDGTTWQEAW